MELKENSVPVFAVHQALQVPIQMTVSDRADSVQLSKPNTTSYATVTEEMAPVVDLQEILVGNRQRMVLIQHKELLISPTHGVSALDIEQPQLDGDSQKPELDSDSHRPELDSESQKPELDSDSQKPELDSDSQKSQLDSDSQKSELDSDSQKPQLDSDSQKPQLDSDSQKPQLDSDRCREDLKLKEHDCRLPVLPGATQTVNASSSLVCSDSNVIDNRPVNPIATTSKSRGVIPQTCVRNSCDPVEATRGKRRECMRV